VQRSIHTGGDARGGPREPGRREEERARAGLTPLAPGERPPALFAAIVVSLATAAAVVAGALTLHDLRRHGGSLPAGLFIAAIFAWLAWGMGSRRYWAVLAFEALLVFQILVTSLALVVASTLPAAGLCLVAIVLGGWLFWKLVRVMGRIQAGDRPPG
jgi:hypothetical protein